MQAPEGSSCSPPAVDRLTTDTAKQPESLPTLSPADRRAKLLSKVDLVVDVGANCGQYAAWIRQAGFNGAIHSFEPLSDPYADLRARAASDPGWRTSRLALGNADGMVELRVAADSASSSLFEPEPRHLRVSPLAAPVRTETVRMARLATVWPEVVRGYERVYLKIDVEGGELNVLRGAAPILERVFLVEVEASLVPLFRGTALFLDVAAYLTGTGYELIGVEPNTDDLSSGTMHMVDAIFRRI
jgi:FkbM family methyltransferase